jgi:Zn-dependent M28 family amino/carboxypeptidase
MLLATSRSAIVARPVFASVFISVATWAVAVTATSSSAQTATTSRTKGHVSSLASDRTEGRLSGSPGERAASDYLVTELKRIGAKPLPGLNDFRVPFDFTAGTKDGGTTVALACATPGPSCSPRTFNTETDVRALSFSDNSEVSGDLVFAGYGIVVPDTQDFGYDSYATLDVKDKIVLVLRYFPEEADPKAKSILTRYSGLRYKAMAARQRGAKGLLVVTGPHSPNAGETIPMSFDTALAGSGVSAASISALVADAIFATLNDPNKTLSAAQKGLDTANPHVAGFAIPTVRVTLKPTVLRENRQANNVFAYLPATTAATTTTKPWVALGAHYDHLGRGDHGNSLATKEDAGAIHHGADDNASGSAAVLAVGEILATVPRKRHVLLQLWSGEEIGLLGSAAFVNKPSVPLDQLAAYLNFDMVGRMQDNKLTLQATGTSDVWGRFIEQANIAAGFDLLLQPDPYQPTDVASFNQAGVPCLNFFTGTHVDYHKPSDTADKINYEDLDRIVEFAGAIARRVIDLETAPTFTKVEQKADPGGGRAGVRVFTGTIPDYSTEVKGLLLSGVIGGGPAEAAGLQKGDVVIEIGGQTIANIYDYTYVLESLKVGQGVKVVYTRSGERRETTLTPSARK